MCCNVWEATACEVHIRPVVLLRFFADVVVKVRCHGIFLVPWLLEIVAETTGRAIPSDFWVETNGSAYTRDIGACRLRELAYARTLNRISVRTGNIGLN
jgi:hypothetical protein